jgi:hypothetical protein
MRAYMFNAFASAAPEVSAIAGIDRIDNVFIVSEGLFSQVNPTGVFACSARLGDPYSLVASRT